MLKRSFFGGLVGAALVIVPVAIMACGSSSALPAPKSDSQSDDPDEPAAPGVIGAIGAGTGKDGGDDASNKCNIDRNCRLGLRCFFPVSEACGAQGQCLDFQDSPGCAVVRRCTCAGTRLETCAPLGYATLPVETVCPDAAPE